MPGTLPDRLKSTLGPFQHGGKGGHPPERRERPDLTENTVPDVFVPEAIQLCMGPGGHPGCRHRDAPRSDTPGSQAGGGAGRKADPWGLPMATRRNEAL